MYLQKESYDCGVAALRTLLSLHGIRASEARIWRWAGTTKADGTKVTGLMKAIEKAGLTPARIIVSDTKPDEALKHVSRIVIRANGDFAHIPAIIPVDNDQHWIVVVGFSGRRYLVWDPEGSIKTYTKKQLLTRWKSPAGHYFILMGWRVV